MRKSLEAGKMRKWRSMPAAIVMLGALLCAPLAAWAQNAIQSITSTQQAGTEVVRIELAQPLGAVPEKALGAIIHAPVAGRVVSVSDRIVLETTP